MSKQKNELENEKNNSQTESEKKPGRKAIFEYVENFCNTATLHGLRYIVEPKRHWFEKCFWIVALVIVTIGAVIIVEAEVKNFSESPIVMSVSGEIVPVWNIPFPAITFCSRNQIRPSFAAKVEGMEEDLRINVSDMKQAFCRADSDNALFNKNYYFKGKMDRNSSIKWSKLFDEQCSDIVQHMTWKNLPLGQSTCKYIQWTSTEQGVCHTFNMLPKRQLYNRKYFESLTNSTDFDSHKPPNWMPESGFSTLDEESIPWRVAGGSIFSSASLFLDMNGDDMSNTCKGKGYGFMITLHSPADLPHGHQPVFVEVDMLSIIEVTPRIVSTAPDLAVWSPLARGCYFHHERSLLFYSIYTQHNCRLECEANVTRQACHCNMFYQPHELHVPLCDESKMECVLSVLSNPYSSKSKGEACNCLPACTEYYYDFELSSMPRNWSYHESSRLSFYGFNIIGNKTKSYLALKVEYAERRVSVMSRVGIFTISDFIANLGGLLGLFIGFSFVSLMEIVYFGPLNIFGYLLEALGKKMNNKIVSIQNHEL